MYTPPPPQPRYFNRAGSREVCTEYRWVQTQFYTAGIGVIHHTQTQTDTKLLHIYGYICTVYRCRVTLVLIHQKN
jgi:hypothetical protein